MSGATDVDGRSIRPGDTVECVIPGCPCFGERQLIEQQRLLQWAADPGLSSTFRAVQPESGGAQ